MKKVLLCGIIIGILSAHLSAFSVPPISLQVLVKRIFAPTLFSVYNKEYGTLYCQLYGIASVSKSFKREACEVTSRSVKEMRHFAMKYIRNRVFLEEQYRLGYKNGWCFLQRGGHLLNAEIVRDGYAVVQYFDNTEQEVLGELEVLEAIAREEKRGLWREWEKEMQCLKTALREIAQEVLAEQEVQQGQ